METLKASGQELKSPEDTMDQVGAERQEPSTDTSSHFNQFATKKTIAQGLLDIALLTNSISQLKYILLAGSSHQFYTILLCSTSISIVLQVLTGIVLLMIGSLTKLKSKAETYNNIVTVLIFLITVLNVLSTSLLDTVTTRELNCKSLTPKPES